MKHFILLISLLTLAACAGSGTNVLRDTPVEPVGGDVEAPGNHWWYARFQMVWPEGQEPDFSNNLIVAHEIVAPALRRHQAEIALWRVHRRARRDQAGHQFSFIFYATAETADAVYTTVAENPVLDQLLEAGVVVALKLDDPAAPSRSEITATSDPSWPDEMQRSWPHYIMGVSAMWLDLVEQGVDGTAFEAGDAEARLQHYREVNEHLTTLWKENGQHALFHHLNAIFGYERFGMRF